MVRSTLVMACLLSCGCAYKVAKLQYDEGFSSTPIGNDRYEVRYSGKALESRTALEKLLRKGVISLCGHETFGLSDVGVATETVMHRWKPEYRYVAAVADCSPQP